VVLALDAPAVFVVLAHLRRGSVAVRPGQRVTTGALVGRCGNSGNSTQPHVHVQAMDGPDAHVARGVPLAFRAFHEHGRDGRTTAVALGVPAEGAVAEPA
jgi:murein DD-endopeptidase MepM/ murein hydrolase activator NlpD